MRRWPALTAVVLIALFAGIFAYGAVSSEDAPVNATVTDLSPRVTVNDDALANATAGDGVSTCLSEGPPPGSYAVVDRFAVQRPIGSGGPETVTFRTEVALANGTALETRNATLERGESERVALTHVGPDDGALAVGETTTVRVRVTRDAETVATSNRTVDVESGGDLDCESALDAGAAGPD